jgi:hypothetical protein
MNFNCNVILKPVAGRRVKIEERFLGFENDEQAKKKRRPHSYLRPSQPFRLCLLAA